MDGWRPTVGKLVGGASEMERGKLGQRQGHSVELSFFFPR